MTIEEEARNGVVHRELVWSDRDVQVYVEFLDTHRRDGVPVGRFLRHVIVSAYGVEFGRMSFVVEPGL